MPDFGSSFPTPVPPRDDVQEAAISMQAEAAPGEVALDAVIRAQSTAPQVVRRITELENCVWAVTDYLQRHGLDEEGRALVQHAKEILKSRLEVDQQPDSVNVGRK